MADTAVLKKILNVKTKEKEDAQLKKAEAVTQFETKASQLYTELKRKEEAESKLQIDLEATTTITTIKNQSQYINLMKTQINQLQLGVQKARTLMEQQQTVLTEAHVEVKKIERLIELRKEKQTALAHKQEMSLMDEISMRQFQMHTKNR